MLRISLDTAPAQKDRSCYAGRTVPVLMYAQRPAQLRLPFPFSSTRLQVNDIVT